MDYIEDYNQKRDFNNLILSFIENDESDEYDECFLEISNFIKEQNFSMNEKLLQEFIDILVNIVNNHHRSPNFFDKIIKIIQLLTKDIQEHFSNEQIFNEFSHNKRIILSLIRNEVILFDKRIIYILSNQKDKFGYKYRHYFPKEIEPHLTYYTKKAQEYELKYRGLDNYLENEFEEKRLKGENESYICSLIREGSTDEFISYVNQKNLSLLTNINPTIFETNILLEKSTALIEYAAFFGSLEIIHYLKYSNVTLTPSLWIYSIHSNNPELIHFLEENDVNPPKNSYKACLKEAIKCHHNSIALYILDKITANNNNYDLQIVIYCLKFKNFSFLPEINIDIYSLLYAACKLNQNDIVIKIFETQKVDINYKYPKKVPKKIVYNSLLKLAADNNNADLIFLFLKQKGIDIQPHTFEKCTIIKKLELIETVRSIKQFAFESFNQLTRITLPSSITIIDKGSFLNCISLVEVIAPSSITVIGDRAFKNCIKLKYFDFPSSITTIGKSSFRNCASLEKVVLPPSVTNIGEAAFEKCGKLNEVALPPFITKINSKTFSNCSSLKSIKIPHSVSEIGTWAFFSCEHLTSCELPESLMRIDNWLFFGCKLLDNVIIPPLVDSIGQQAFYQCYSLTEIDIPKSIKRIGRSAFDNCKSLKNVKINSNDCIIEKSAFSQCPSIENSIFTSLFKS